MYRNKQKHAYDPDMQRELRGVALPAKVKCSRCEKYYSCASFSEKQLYVARFAVMKQGVHAKYHVTCAKCTGGPIVELECTMCHKTKGLEAFAKKQRAKADSAKCFACMEDQLGQNPIDEDNYEDPQKAHDPDDTSGGAYPEYWSNRSHGSDSVAADENEYGSDDESGGIKLDLNSSLNSNLNSNTGSLIGSDFTVPSANDNSGGWQVAKSNSSWNTTTATPKSGFGLNHHGQATPNSISGTSKTLSSNFTDQDTSHAKGGWAKIKAYKPEAPVQADDWDSDDEEEYSESDDDGYEIEI